MTAEV